MAPRVTQKKKKKHLVKATLVLTDTCCADGPTGPGSDLQFPGFTHQTQCFRLIQFCSVREAPSCPISQNECTFHDVDAGAMLAHGQRWRPCGKKTQHLFCSSASLTSFLSAGALFSSLLLVYHVCIFRESVGRAPHEETDVQRGSRLWRGGGGAGLCVPLLFFNCLFLPPFSKTRSPPALPLMFSSGVPVRGSQPPRPPQACVCCVFPRVKRHYPNI